MRSTVIALVVVAVAAAACATARDTRAQDLAWERWKACDHFPTIALDRIERDGRLVVKGYEVEAAPFTACVAQAAADQFRRGATDRPEALVLVKLYGCMGGAM
jgi:hypothetical protein